MAITKGDGFELPSWDVLSGQRIQRYFDNRGTEYYKGISGNGDVKIKAPKPAPLETSEQYNGWVDTVIAFIRYPSANKSVVSPERSLFPRYRVGMMLGFFHPINNTFLGVAKVVELQPHIFALRISRIPAGVDTNALLIGDYQTNTIIQPKGIDEAKNSRTYVVDKAGNITQKAKA